MHPMVALGYCPLVANAAAVVSWLCRSESSVGLASRARGVLPVPPCPVGFAAKFPHVARLVPLCRQSITMQHPLQCGPGVRWGGVGAGCFD
eukprot:365159-Chlamydomonas_euryale.AAC.15